MHLLMADLQLHSWDMKDIVDQFTYVPVHGLGLAAFGALLGLIASAVIDPLPTPAAIFLGMAVALLAGGFNDPELGVIQPGPQPHCLELAGECVQPDLRSGQIR
jgi:hypothetical protein